MAASAMLFLGWFLVLLRARARRPSC